MQSPEIMPHYEFQTIISKSCTVSLIKGIYSILELISKVWLIKSCWSASEFQISCKLLLKFKKWSHLFWEWWARLQIQETCILKTEKTYTVTNFFFFQNYMLACDIKKKRYFSKQLASSQWQYIGVFKKDSDLPIHRKKWTFKCHTCNYQCLSYRRVDSTSFILHTDQLKKVLQWLNTSLSNLTCA